MEETKNDEQPVVFIHGAKQQGKTSELVKQILSNYK